MIQYSKRAIVASLLSATILTQGTPISFTPSLYAQKVKPTAEEVKIGQQRLEAHKANKLAWSAYLDEPRLVANDLYSQLQECVATRAQYDPKYFTPLTIGSLFFAALAIGNWVAPAVARNTGANSRIGRAIAKARRLGASDADIRIALGHFNSNAEALTDMIDVLRVQNTALQSTEGASEFRAINFEGENNKLIRKLFAPELAEIAIAEQAFMGDTGDIAKRKALLEANVDLIEKLGSTTNNFNKATSEIIQANRGAVGEAAANNLADRLVERHSQMIEELKTLNEKPYKSGVEKTRMLELMRDTEYFKTQILKHRSDFSVDIQTGKIKSGLPVAGKSITLAEAVRLRWYQRPWVRNSAGAAGVVLLAFGLYQIIDARADAKASSDNWKTNLFLDPQSKQHHIPVYSSEGEPYIFPADFELAFLGFAHSEYFKDEKDPELSALLDLAKVLWYLDDVVNSTSMAEGLPKGMPVQSITKEELAKVLETKRVLGETMPCYGKFFNEDQLINLMYAIILKNAGKLDEASSTPDTDGSSEVQLYTAPGDTTNQQENEAVDY